MPKSPEQPPYVVVKDPKQPQITVIETERALIFKNDHIRPTTSSIFIKQLLEDIGVHENPIETESYKQALSRDRTFLLGPQ